VKVTAPQDYSHVTPLARPVAAGEEVEVDDVLGEQLIAQGWTATRSRSPRPKPSTEGTPDEAPAEAQTQE